MKHRSAAAKSAPPAADLVSSSTCGTAPSGILHRLHPGVTNHPGITDHPENTAQTSTATPPAAPVHFLKAVAAAEVAAGGGNQARSAAPWHGRVGPGRPRVCGRHPSPPGGTTARSIRVTRSESLVTGPGLMRRRPGAAPRSSRCPPPAVGPAPRAPCRPPPSPAPAHARLNRPRCAPRQGHRPHTHTHTHSHTHTHALRLGVRGGRPCTSGASGKEL